MAVKRVFLETGSDPDQPEDRGRPPRDRPSLASVIGEAVVMNSLHNSLSALEPLLRRVVNEETEEVIRRRARISRSPSLRIRPPPQPAMESSSTLQLVFSNSPSTSIFSGAKIADPQNNSLRLALVDAEARRPVSLEFPLKVHIVALYGDFPPEAGTAAAAWTREEFEKNVVRERDGKRPLIAGDVCVTVRDGGATVGEIEFTDNSSWVRSKRFRIGARAAAPPERSGVVRIREAWTDAFRVRDRRGELYKKHHPPRLQDEVWRLEKIGKEGAFHKKLRSAGIHTVQDFLKLSVVDPWKLRKILGMSDKKWEVTIAHAQTCTLGSKLYVSHGLHGTVVVNPICQVVKATINGQPHSTMGINSTYVEMLAREAYENWNSLEEIKGLPNGTQLLAEGDGREESLHAMASSLEPSGYGPNDPAPIASHLEYVNWPTHRDQI